MYNNLLIINNNSMNKIKNLKLLKIFLFLANILLLLFIIKECRILNFCCIIISLVSPCIFGFVIAWVIKPLMLFFNKKFNTYVSSGLSFLLLGLFIFSIGYFLVPVIIKEFGNLLPNLVNLYKKYSSSILKYINIGEIGKRFVRCTMGVKETLINAFYAFFIAFFFLTNHKETTRFITKRVPTKLSLDITSNLRMFVKGTLLDTLILFIMSLITFSITKMPYALLFAIFTSITNIIPFIGPYIGGVPAVLVSLTVSFKFGIIVMIEIILLQFIESSFIHPYIMSKGLKINPIVILIGLIVFGYFFGIIGMIISTPLISVIKSVYEYYQNDIKKVLHK